MVFFTKIIQIINIEIFKLDLNISMLMKVGQQKFTKQFYVSTYRIVNNIKNLI